MQSKSREQKSAEAISLSESLLALKQKGTERDVGYIAGLIDGLVRAEQKEEQHAKDETRASGSSR